MRALRLVQRAAVTTGVRYLSWVAAVTAGGLTLVAGLVGWIDPYGRRIAVEPGRNQFKPALVDSTRLFAAELVTRTAPATLIVGNSRLLVALDPSCPELAWTPAPRVNACLGSASMYEVRRMVEHAAAQGALRTVILAADWDLYGTDSGTMPGWSEARLAVAADGRPQPFHRWADTAAAAWSWTAVGDAWTCWQGSRTGHPDRIDLATGFAGRTDYWRSRIAEHGHRGVARWMESTWGRGMRGWRDDETYRAREARLQDELARTLTTAWAAGAEVQVVLAPVHARWRVLLETLGMGPAWTRHRHNVVAVVERAAVSAGRPVPTVWDFATWDGPNAEPFPGDGDRAPMQWWWESNHSQATFGAAMATRLAGGEGPGVPLTAATLDAELERQDAARSRWLAAHADDADEVQAALR